MAIFPVRKYPYTDYHDVNLDYILEGFKGFEDDIASLKQRMTSAESDITSLTNRMTTAEGNISSLSSRMTTAEGNISSLLSRMNTAEGNINSLLSRMHTAEVDIGELKQDVINDQSDILDLKGRMSTAENTLNTAVTSTIPAIQQNIEGIEEDIYNIDSHCIRVFYIDHIPEGIPGETAGITLRTPRGGSIIRLVEGTASEVYEINFNEFQKLLKGLTLNGANFPAYKFISRRHTTTEGSYIYHELVISRMVCNSDGDLVEVEFWMKETDTTQTPALNGESVYRMTFGTGDPVPVTITLSVLS